MFFFDPMYFLFMLPPILFVLYAQSRVSSSFKKYSKVANMRGVTGGQAAQVLLRANKLSSIGIEGTRGKLTDHYDPRHKVLRLSREVYNNPSVAALGIVAHEVGHAVQDNIGYIPLRMRSALVPVANLGTRLGYIFIILGIILYLFSGFGLDIAWIGVFLFAGVVLFSLVTLPVEYNASSRARQMLRSSGLVSAQEYEAASTVLSAAALTYVAAMLQALATLFYFVFALLGMGRQ
jgi:hypothetical protein